MFDNKDKPTGRIRNAFLAIPIALGLSGAADHDNKAATSVQSEQQMRAIPEPKQKPKPELTSEQAEKLAYFLLLESILEKRAQQEQH